MLFTFGTNPIWDTFRLSSIYIHSQRDATKMFLHYSSARTSNHCAESVKKMVSTAQTFFSTCFFFFRFLFCGPTFTRQFPSVGSSSFELLLPGCVFSCCADVRPSRGVRRDYAKEQLFTWLWFCLFLALDAAVSRVLPPSNSLPVVCSKYCTRRTTFPNIH